MINIYPAESRYTADHGWLLSRFSFSFAQYFDPDNMQFGPLRVFNDDIVQPQKGFGSHPHQEMEIVSVVLKGKLQHKDSVGHTVTTGFGEVQRMSAGTGIVHSEMNPSDSQEVNFLQLWFLPDTKGLTPSYEHTSYDVRKMKNALLPIVSKSGADQQVAYIHQDLTMYLSDLDPGRSLTFSQRADRRTYLFVIKGNLEVNAHGLKERDSARIENETKLHLATESGAMFMLIDLP